MTGFKTAKVVTPDWTEAACAKGDPEIFHYRNVTVDADKIAAARAICAECKIIQKCFEYAMVATDHLGHHLQGVWAGTTSRQRHLLRERQKANT